MRNAWRKYVFLIITVFRKYVLHTTNELYLEYYFLFLFHHAGQDVQ